MANKEDKLILDRCLGLLQDTDLGLPLVWLYTWDVVKDNLVCGDWNPLVTEDEAWDLLCEAVATGNGFSLEYGAEQLHEDVRDWMFNRDMIADLEDEDA